MSISLAQFLRARSVKSFQGLIAEVDSVDSTDAHKFTTALWPDHRWGIGQNGSIAGIVYHVAAWKQMTLPVFDVGGKPLTREQFDASRGRVNPEDWPAIVEWIKKIGDAWNARLAELTDDEFESEREWEGKPLPISSFVVEMYEHDIQHASQIAYLIQRLDADHGR